MKYLYHCIFIYLADLHEGCLGFQETDEEKPPVIMLKPEVQEEMESNDSAALCIGPGCSKQALPDSGYCGTDCILQHAAVTMKALSGVSVPKSRGRTQKKAPVITSITRVSNLNMRSETVRCTSQVRFNVKL